MSSTETDVYHTKTVQRNILLAWAPIGENLFGIKKMFFESQNRIFPVKKWVLKFRKKTFEIKVFYFTAKKKFS